MGSTGKGRLCASYPFLKYSQQILNTCAIILGSIPNVQDNRQFEFQRYF
jgi:hypothetical protein